MLGHNVLSLSVDNSSNCPLISIRAGDNSTITISNRTSNSYGTNLIKCICLGIGSSTIEILTGSQTRITNLIQLCYSIYLCEIDVIKISANLYKRQIFGSAGATSVLRQFTKTDFKSFSINIPESISQLTGNCHNLRRSFVPVVSGSTGGVVVTLGKAIGDQRRLSIGIVLLAYFISTAVYIAEVLLADFIFQEVLVLGLIVSKFLFNSTGQLSISHAVHAIDSEINTIDSESNIGVVKTGEELTLLVDNVDVLDHVLADLPLGIDLGLVLVLGFSLAVLVQTDIQGSTGGDDIALLYFLEHAVLLYIDVLPLSVGDIQRIVLVGTGERYGGGTSSHNSGQNQRRDLLCVHFIFLHV